MGNSRKNTLAQTIVLNSSRSGNVDLPMGQIINQIRVRVTGTYGGIDGTLASEFPYNIFRLLTVKTTKGSSPYAIPSKDLRIMNYEDKAGKTTFSAAGGVFVANFVLDRGELMALKDADMPHPIDHPALPFGGLSLIVSWAQDADITTGANTITAATAEIEVEQTPMTILELQHLYGDKLERYQMPEVYTKGDVAIVANTKPTSALVLDVGKLKKRTIIVTSDNLLVRSSSIATEVQLVNAKTGYEKNPIDRTFLTIQNEDVEGYNLSAALAGVATIDYAEEIANNPWGFPSWRLGDKDLSIFTLNGNGNLRVIEDGKVVNPTAFENGNILGVVVGQYPPKP
jgi:hypothetical protein